MPTFQIVSHKNEQQFGPDPHDLPTFYMEDFSLLGFRVSDCEKALRILEKSTFSMRRDGLNPAVHLQDSAQAATVVRLLSEGGVRCDIADVAGGMYQG